MRRLSTYTIATCVAVVMVAVGSQAHRVFAQQEAPQKPLRFVRKAPAKLFVDPAVPDLQPATGVGRVGITGYVTTKLANYLPIAHDGKVTIGVQRTIIVPDRPNAPRDRNRVRVEVYSGAVTRCGGDPEMVDSWDSEPFDVAPGTSIVDSALRPEFRLPAGVYTVRVDLQEWVKRGTSVIDDITGEEFLFEDKDFDWHTAARKTEKFRVQ